MALIKTVNGITPTLGEGCFLADNATLIGDVICGKDCSFWFSSVTRGDVHQIRIGDNTNIQDGAIIHCTYQTAPTTIGSNVSIGHRAIVHGCTIHDNTLIGMGAIVMDHAIVPQHCLVAAGAVVLENSVLESGYIYAGVPAKKVKKLSSQAFEQMVLRTANNYKMYGSWYSSEL